jgi:hypothetical protein
MAHLGLSSGKILLQVLPWEIPAKIWTHEPLNRRHKKIEPRTLASLYFISPKNEPSSRPQKTTLKKIQIDRYYNY